MTAPTTVLFAAAALCAGLAIPLRSPAAPAPVPAAAQDPEKAAPQGQDDMKVMMEKAAKFTKPGPNHKQLERFLGKWKTETKPMMGGMAPKGAPGEAEFTWLANGRWLQMKSKTSMMGMPFEIFSLLGYDNFKQSFVWTQVTTMDTAMLHAEGDMDPSGKALLMYGTIDEYLTGEHDKMCKYVWRFLSDDEMVLEVHDLPIGEKNTEVVESHFTRVK